MTIKIDKGIPIPMPIRLGHGLTEYLRALEVGDSFLHHRQCRSYIYKLALKIGIKITSRPHETDPDKVRAWRIK